MSQVQYVLDDQAPIVGRNRYVADRGADLSSIEIDPAMPWGSWEQPESYDTSLRALRAMVLNDQVVMGRLTESGEEVLGLPESGALQQLGWATTFPVGFVEKLSPETRATVINERIIAAKESELSVIVEAGRVTNLAKGWRSILPYGHTCQHVWDTLRAVYGDSVHLDRAEVLGSKMKCRILTERMEPVTPRVGDVLSLGIDVEQSYGETIYVSLFSQRLACLNGMRRSAEEYRWTQRTQGTVGHQLAWLTQGVNAVVGQYDSLLQHARTMAETEFDGNPADVLREHARAMHLPKRYVDALLDAFNQEPGRTEWDVLNAFTRLATHGALPEQVARAVQQSAGDWIGDFEIVECRLPRPMALRVGAHILTREELELAEA